MVTNSPIEPDGRSHLLNGDIAKLHFYFSNQKHPSNKILNFVTRMSSIPKPSKSIVKQQKPPKQQKPKREPKLYEHKAASGKIIYVKQTTASVNHFMFGGCQLQPKDVVNASGHPVGSRENPYILLCQNATDKRLRKSVMSFAAKSNVGVMAAVEEEEAKKEADKYQNELKAFLAAN